MGKCMFMRKGEVHSAPSRGILASELAVGSTVKLNENGSPVEYLVVHSGLPSTMYDASCDGLWLLRKDIYNTQKWHSSNSNSYKASTIHSYLNSTFLGLFDTDTQTAIRQAKIPYVNGTAASSVASGAKGLSTKIFLLGMCELGWKDSDYPYFPVDGAFLDYFSSLGTTDRKRIAYFNGTAYIWWTRAPYTESVSNACTVNAGGGYGYQSCTKTYGVRPALILPSNAVFDEDTMILKGVA